MSRETGFKLASLIVSGLALAGGILGWAATARVSMAMAPLETRVSVVESKQADDRGRLERIEKSTDEIRNDVKELLKR